MNSHLGAGGRAALEASDLLVQFGGRKAVNDLSFVTAPGTVTGLIGPNGAGKTTTFNACSGLVGLAGGRLSLFGRDISRMSAPRRARHGLGRTFQQIELCGRLTVAENVALGAEAKLAGRGPRHHLWATRRENAVVREHTQQALQRCGLEGLASTLASDLSTGPRRLTELARCIAAQFTVLLLDEPSSGLDPVETAAFGQIVSTFVRDSGAAVLLIEHDISLVRQICSYIYVLDFGELIEEGPIEQVLASSKVAAAYLGSDGIDG